MGTRSGSNGSCQGNNSVSSCVCSCVSVSVSGISSW